MSCSLRLFFTTLVALGLSTPLIGQPKQAVHPSSEKWPSLFNQKLDNANFPKGVWYLDENGYLTATEDQTIWTHATYTNFVLDLEYKCGPAANSGVMIYASDVNDWIPNSIEVQILDNHHKNWESAAPTWKNGGLFGRLAPAVDNVRPAGSWNRMTITAKGKQIQVIVNGQITVDTDISAWTDAKKNPDGSDIPFWLNKPMAILPTQGRIGLQGKHGGAPIYFRYIRIQELK
jgi:hypothetical protein